MSNPFANMSAAEMELLRVQDPVRFAALEQQLDVPQVDRSKAIVFQNGRVVSNANVSRPE
jgi:hypothetical protein